MKKRICYLLVICLCLSMFPTAVLAAEAPGTLSIEPASGNGLPAAIDLVPADTQNPGDLYNLYLPGDAVLEECFFSWEGDSLGTLNGKSYASGTLPIPAVGESLRYEFSGKTFTVTSYQGSAAVPPIFIEIDESQGSIADMNGDPNHDATCTGIIFIDGEEHELDKIKGRGNATWYMAKEKRPYNITLGSKANILGIDSEKTKKWSMLANIADRSLLRNKIGYDMSHELGIGQDSASADVWMNGEYIGVYLVTPKTDSFISDAGYGIEHDNYVEPPIEQGGDPSFTLDGTSSPGGKQVRITVKKIGDDLLPDGESVESLKAAAKEIQNYLQKVWDALRDPSGYNAEGVYYADYIDVPTWAAMYLMQEYVRGHDADAGSLLFYRDGTTAEDKLYAGPMWDLDNALGSNQGTGAVGVTLADANGWFMRNLAPNCSSLYKTAGQHQDFMDMVTRVYQQNQALFDEAPARIQALAKDLEASALMNDVRVTRETYNNAAYYGETVLSAGTKYEQVYKATYSWQAYVDNLETFTRVRSAFLRDNLSEEVLGYRAQFTLGPRCEITAYDTRDCSGAGHAGVSQAIARNGETGELDISGQGEINFRLQLPKGFRLKELTVSPAANYGELLSLEEGLYRITNITGAVSVRVETELLPCEHQFVEGVCSLCGAQAFRVELRKDSHCAITVYETPDHEGEGLKNPGSVYARDEAGNIDLLGQGQVNLLITPAEGYRILRISVEPEEHAELLRPAQTGVTGGYRLENITEDLTLTIRTASLGAGVDFTNPAYENYFELVNPRDSEIREGEGLYMLSTRASFEPCSGQLSELSPQDLVLVPVAGDWTATLNFSFDPALANNGYYQYFGFYAMADYNNCAGIRMGESASQDFLRRAGSITEETMNVSPGLEASGDYWLRIQKEGSSYTCFSSADGEEFTELFRFADTGIEAEHLCIDAYTGMTEGYTYLLKTLTFEGEGGTLLPPNPCEHEYEQVLTEATCLEGGFTTCTCALCGDSYVADETAALGHDYEAKVTEATCTEGGFTAHICSRCDDSYRDSETPALGHAWDEGTITTAPTEDASGIKTYTCERCGESKTEILPVHIHRYLRSETPATCTEPGLAEYTCDCGRHYSHELPALGHSYENGLCIRCEEAEAHRCPGAAFTDYPAQGHWAHESMDVCVERGLMKGTDQSHFSPQGSLTRAQLVTILYRLAGSPELAFHGVFQDVPDGLWYSAAVEWAAAQGIVTGRTPTRFDPNGEITREQIAAMLYRYQGSPAVAGELEGFLDAETVSPYAVDALLWATEQGLIQGLPQGDALALSPHTQATRAQIACILHRYVELEA